MSENKTNHVTEAKTWINNAIKAQATNEPETLATAYAGIAQAHATLALAEEQRIANLIAIGSNAARMVAEGIGDASSYVTLHSKLNPLIQEGLGL